MKLNIELSESQERGLGFACDQANAVARQNLTPEQLESFVPETREQYAQRIFSGACDSYDAQRASEFERQKVEAFRALPPEQQAKVLAAIDTPE